MVQRGRIEWYMIEEGLNGMRDEGVNGMRRGRIDLHEKKKDLIE